MTEIDDMEVSLSLDDSAEDDSFKENENIEKAIVEENIKPVRKLDYTLETPQERNKLVKLIVAETPPEQLTNRYLEILTDYIIFAMDKEERKERKILTDNRMVTVNKRETSFQGLVGKLENGEDGIYNIITNDKNIIFTPKVSITQKDLEEIPELKQLKEAMEIVEQQEKVARGKKKYLLKKQLIEMRKDQYVIKSSYRKPIYCMNLIKSFSQMDLGEKFYIDKVYEDGELISADIKSTGKITFLNPAHVSAILCNYSKLKEDAYGRFENDSYYLMEDLDDLIECTLKDDYPLYYDLLIYKIDGKQNIEIQELLYEKYNIKHSLEYISSLWRNKIPKLIAEKAQEKALIWYYTEIEKGQWKKCTRCGQIKLAHNKFFSKNKTSKDGFYSICKCCRNKKK